MCVSQFSVFPSKAKKGTLYKFVRSSPRFSKSAFQTFSKLAQLRERPRGLTQLQAHNHLAQCGVQSLRVHLARLEGGVEGIPRATERSETVSPKQVRRHEADIKAQEELDMYYIRNWSLWLDLYILVRTVPVVIKQRGAQ